jgi:hypothetical protein
MDELFKNLTGHSYAVSYMERYQILTYFWDNVDLCDAINRLYKQLTSAQTMMLPDKLVISEKTYKALEKELSSKE